MINVAYMGATIADVQHAVGVERTIAYTTARRHVVGATLGDT
mgnify:CR=1 FL=1